MDEIKIKKELERLKWLRKAAYMMPPCKTADETSIKVTNLTLLVLEGRLQSLRGNCMSASIQR